MQTIDNFLKKWKTLDKAFLVYKNKTLSYSNVFDRVTVLGNVLAGVNATDQNIAIFATNSPEYVISYFTIIFSGSTNIPVNVKLTDPEIKSEIIYCDCNWIIAQSKYIDRLLTIAGIIHVGIIEIDENYKATIIRYPRKVVQRQNTSEIAVMLHTSGTTGKPQKVMLTHKNLVANTCSNIKSLKLSNEDTVLVALPLFFGYCHTAQFLTHTRLGGTIVIYDQAVFTARHFCHLIQEYKVTCFTAVPAMLAIIDNYKYLDTYRLATLRYICFGGGFMAEGMLARLMKKLPGAGIVQTYGQTECSPRVTALLPKDSIRKMGSVGKPIPRVKVQIVKDDGNLVNTNEVGEILVKGRNITPGYYKRDDETRKILKVGWLYTGDLAYLDEEGFIYLVGRKKNMIISGGINIYPEEIEKIIKGFPGIEDACVTGEKHKLLGEVPVAFVVWKDTTGKNNRNELRGHCAKSLASYKIPVRFEAVKELPTTATGKLNRALMKG